MNEWITSKPLGRYAGAAIFLFIDSDARSILNAPDVRYRHGQRTTTAFLDGHVEQRTAATLATTTTAPWR